MSGVPAYEQPFLAAIIFVAISLIIYLFKVKLSDEFPSLLVVFRCHVFQ